MKRLIAKRKLKRICDLCKREINKGEVYYKERKIFSYENLITAYNLYMCPKCKCKQERHKIRFEKFKKVCTHPKIDTQWGYIQGEAVMEPKYEFCILCGKIL